MSAAGLLPSFRKLYKKAQLEVTSWETLQIRAEDQFRTAVNVLERLPVMQDDSSYGVLQEIPGLPGRIRDKQLKELEALFKRLNSSLLQMEEVVLSLNRLTQEAAKLHISAGKHTLEASFLRMMLRSELALKHALVKSLTYESSERDMEEASACFRAQPNINSARIADTLYLVASTEPIDKR